MKTKSSSGFSLVELSLVILVLLALAAMSVYFVSNIQQWKRGKEASETLRSALAAQKSYLADHPTTPVNTLTREMITSYLPNREATFPTVTSNEGAQLQIKVDVMPPVVEAPGGGTYDPSGNSADGLWDVGKL